MIAKDKDALICDLAETYGIFDLIALPVHLLATLSAGLRDDSRVKMQLNETSISPNTMLLAAAVDRLSFLAWTKTKDAEKGQSYPKSILAFLINQTEEKEIISFDSAEDFIAERKKIIGEEIESGD